jgi:DnaJ-class molecular chaperone
MGRNYYELLGVSEDASADEIRVAYRAAMLRNHPDLHEGGGSGKDSRNLNLAYETLASAIKRAQYDDRLRRHRTQQSERRNAESSNPHSQSSTPEDDTGFANLFHRNRLVFVSSAAGLLLFFGWVVD